MSLLLSEIVYVLPVAKMLVTSRDEVSLPPDASGIDMLKTHGIKCFYCQRER